MAPLPRTGRSLSGAEGRWKVKNPTLQRLHKEVRDVAARFGRVEYEHVRRERNTEADRLANEGVDAWLAPGRAAGPASARAVPLWDDDGA